MLDFGAAFGNADFHDASSTEGFQFDFAVESDFFQTPFWWPFLALEEAFAQRFRAR